MLPVIFGRLVSGGGAAGIGALAITYRRGNPELQNAGLGMTIVGTVVAGGGVALLFLPPRKVDIRCPVYRVRVRIDATFVPVEGAAYETSGNADILVSESTSPCADVDTNGFFVEGSARDN